MQTKAVHKPKTKPLRMESLVPNHVTNQPAVTTSCCRQEVTTTKNPLQPSSSSSSPAMVSGIAKDPSKQANFSWYDSDSEDEDEQPQSRPGTSSLKSKRQQQQLKSDTDSKPVALSRCKGAKSTKKTDITSSPTTVMDIVKDPPKKSSFSWYDSDSEDEEETPLKFRLDESSAKDETFRFDVRDDPDDDDYFDSERWQRIRSANASWTSLHDSSSSSLSSRTRRRKIKFSDVEIREYALVVGDHPCCEDGLPLELDWKHNPYQTVVDVDTYMEMKKRESVGDLVCPQKLLVYQYLPEPPKRLSPEERKARLKSVSGFSEKQLEDATTKRMSDLQLEWTRQCETSKDGETKDAVSEAGEEKKAENKTK